ncbi:hypothetical protein pb186bvf_005369 [Paramecium bursaria]
MITLGNQLPGVFINDETISSGYYFPLLTQQISRFAETYPKVDIWEFYEYQLKLDEKKG